MSQMYLNFVLSLSTHIFLLILIYIYIFHNLLNYVQLTILVCGNYTSSFFVSKFANSPRSSTFLANISTFSTISINEKMKLEIARLSSFSTCILKGGCIRLNCNFKICNFGIIKILARHLFIFSMLSPSSLIIHTSDKPSISHGSSTCFLCIGEGW